jgi:hypothetical protein
MVLSRIGLNFKLAPVIFQNIGPRRGNGVMGAIQQFSLEISFFIRDEIRPLLMIPV